MTPKLTIELVPATCWYSNVREVVDTPTWDRLRKEVYAAAGNKCEVCGGRGPKWPVECHEVWGYNDESLIQTLDRMIALCPDCHGVKHMGRSQIVGNGDKAAKHLAKVNGWSAATTKAYIDEAFSIWQERSRQNWKCDLTFLSKYGLDGEALTLRTGISRAKGKTE